MRQIEIDQIVAQQEVRAIGKSVQLGQCRVQIASHGGEEHGATSIQAHGSEFVDATVLAADFKVQ